MSDSYDECELINNIHIEYLNYKFIRKTKIIIEVKDFDCYLKIFHKFNYNYYKELCKKFNFNEFE